MSTEELRNNLKTESGIVRWQELEKHFARGVIRVISSNINLIDIAVDIAQNNTVKISDALESKAVTEATNSQAEHWQQQNTVFLCVVVAPFVLIQKNKT